MEKKSLAIFMAAVDSLTPAREAAEMSRIHFFAASNAEAGIISGERVNMNSASVSVVKPDGFLGFKIILAIVALFYV